MSCSSPERELLTFWLAGSLRAEEAARVSAHVETCAACRADAASGRALIEGFRSLHLTVEDIVAAAAGGAHASASIAHLAECTRCRDEVATLRAINDDFARRSARHGQRREWIIGLAAAATVVIAVPILWRLGSPAPIRPAPPAAVTAPHGASQAPAIARPHLVVEKPALTALADESLAVRGRDNPRRALLDDLAAALEPYRRGDYGESATRLRALAQTRPEAPEIPYYLGVCLLLSDRPADAIAPLTEANRRSPSPEAAYYLAVARINAGDVAAGTDTLTRLCGGRSSIAPRACAAARQLSTPSPR